MGKMMLVQVSDGKTEAFGGVQARGGEAEQASRCAQDAGGARARIHPGLLGKGTEEFDFGAWEVKPGLQLKSPHS